MVTALMVPNTNPSSEQVRLKSASGGDGTSLDNIPFLKSFIIGLVQVRSLYTTIGEFLII